MLCKLAFNTTGVEILQALLDSHADVRNGDMGMAALELAEDYNHAEQAKVLQQFLGVECPPAPTTEITPEQKLRQEPLHVTETCDEVHQEPPQAYKDSDVGDVSSLTHMSHQELLKQLSSYMGQNQNLKKHVMHLEEPESLEDARRDLKRTEVELLDTEMQLEQSKDRFR